MSLARRQYERLPGLPGLARRPAGGQRGSAAADALTGLLLNGAVAPFAKFDRKNYFYPDMPKNYQITQYDQPSTRGGYVDFEFEGSIHRVRLTRAHLEEDVGKSSISTAIAASIFTGRRAALEIVSSRTLPAAEMAYAYLNALKDILVHGGVSDCDMEKGMVRCDVNVSVRPRGTPSSVPKSRSKT